MSTVEEKRRYREAFVNALYDMTEENPTLTFPDYREVGKQADVPEADLISVVEWLGARNLLEWKTSHWVGITSHGIEVVERMRAPAPLPVPAARNVVQIVGDIGGGVQIQQASPEGKQVHGALDSPESINVIRQILDLVAGALGEADSGDEDRADVEEELALLRTEIAQQNPKRSVLRRSLLALGRMAEGLPPSVAVALAQHFHVLGL